MRQAPLQLDLVGVSCRLPRLDATEAKCSHRVVQQIAAVLVLIEDLTIEPTGGRHCRSVHLATTAWKSFVFFMEAAKVMFQSLHVIGPDNLTHIFLPPS